MCSVTFPIPQTNNSYFVEVTSVNRDQNVISAPYISKSISKLLKNLHELEYVNIENNYFNHYFAIDFH